VSGPSLSLSPPPLPPVPPFPLVPPPPRARRLSLFLRYVPPSALQLNSQRLDHRSVRGMFALHPRPAALALGTVTAATCATTTHTQVVPPETSRRSAPRPIGFFRVEMFTVYTA